MESDKKDIQSKLGILAEADIKKRLKEGELIVHPPLFKPTQIKGCRIDLRLGGVFYEIKQSGLSHYDTLTPPEEDYRRKITLPVGKGYILHPQTFILAETFENVKMSNDLLGILQGRSSLGRLGIIVHATAAFIDPGYSGTITLELSNLGHLPVKLYTLQRVASLAFILVSGATPYKEGIRIPLKDKNLIDTGKYDSAISEPSKISEDWERDILKMIGKDLSESYSSNA